MTSLKSSPFLAAAMRVIRADRPALSASQPHFTRIERVPAGNYVEVWFRTAGCTWDRAGGCTMCNYGHAESTSASDLHGTIATALAALPAHPDELMISPSGGMWDPIEVPAEALPAVYAMARAAAPGKFFVETRAETVTVARVSALRAAFPSTKLAVEIGLESSDDAVLAYCVNKGSTTRTFTQAAALLDAADIEVYANVCLGTALLDRATAVRDAIASIRWVLSHGATTAVVFPLHVKPYTLLALLRAEGRYAPVSLWDLVEVLVALGPAFADRVEIAWYKSYYDTDAKITASPQGCTSCHSDLMARLDIYRATQDHAVIAALWRDRCACASTPALACPFPTTGQAIPAAILNEYAAIAAALDLRTSWEAMKPRIAPMLTQAFDGYAARLAEATTHVG